MDSHFRRGKKYFCGRSWGGGKRNLFVPLQMHSCAHWPGTKEKKCTQEKSEKTPVFPGKKAKKKIKSPLLKTVGLFLLRVRGSHPSPAPPRPIVPQLNSDKEWPLRPPPPFCGKSRAVALTKKYKKNPPIGVSASFDRLQAQEAISQEVSSLPSFSAPNWLWFPGYLAKQIFGNKRGAHLGRKGFYNSLFWKRRGERGRLSGTCKSRLPCLALLHTGVVNSKDLKIISAANMREMEGRGDA